MPKKYVLVESTSLKELVDEVGYLKRYVKKEFGEIKESLEKLTDYIDDLDGILEDDTSFEAVLKRLGDLQAFGYVGTTGNWQSYRFENYTVELYQDHHNTNDGDEIDSANRFFQALVQHGLRLKLIEAQHVESTGRNWYTVTKQLGSNVLLRIDPQEEGGYYMVCILNDGAHPVTIQHMVSEGNLSYTY
jgi:hypothetical protein